MTSFKITNDDVAVRGLQEGNKTPVILGPVLPVKPSNPVQKSPENIAIQSQLSGNKQTELPHSHRRHHDRRQENKTVLLDTRSKHDRRINEIEDEDDSELHLHGIDKLV